MANTFELISTITVPSGGAAAIEFTSIPQTYTDLQIVFSARNTNTASGYAANWIRINGADISERNFVSDNGSVGSYSGTTMRLDTISDSNTANTFTSLSVYITNYAASGSYKSLSVDDTFESNGGYRQAGIWSGQYASNTPITSVSYINSSPTIFKQYSTASLYGITKGSGGATVA